MITVKAVSACGTYKEVLRLRADEVGGMVQALHAEGWVVTVPDAWKALYRDNPCRDWTCADLDAFIKSDSREPKEWAIEFLAFRQQHSMP